MSLLTRDRPAPAAQDPGDQRRSLGLGQWAAGRSVMTSARLLHWVLWGAVVLAVLAAIAAFLRPTPAPAPVKLPTPSTGPAGIAELYVAEWLTQTPGESFSVAPFWPGRADLGARPPLPGPSAPPAVKVLRTTAVDVRELSPSYWSVTVAAVLEAEGGPVTRFFRAPIYRTPDKVYVASALPAETTAPLGLKAPDLAVGSARQPDPASPLTAAVTRFLGALLAGDGELSRYVAPGSVLRAVKPAPYVGVEVTGVAVRDLPEGNREVYVEAVGTDAAGRAFPFAYPLEVAERAGRWEVVAVLAAPAIPEAQPDLRVSPATTVAPIITVPSTTVPSTTTVNPSATTTTRRN